MKRLHTIFWGGRVQMDSGFRVHEVLEYRVQEPMMLLLGVEVTMRLSGSWSMSVADSALARRSKLARKADIWLPGKGKSNSHSARPVHQIIQSRTSRLSTKHCQSR